MISAINVTTELEAKCLDLLRRAHEPLTAAVIAERIGLQGNRENQRRKVRAIVKSLREGSGVKIVANLQNGYWITGDDQIWKQWLEHRKVDAVRLLAETNRRKKEIIADHSGQSYLFAPGGGK